MRNETPEYWYGEFDYRSSPSAHKVTVSGIFTEEEKELFEDLPGASFSPVTASGDFLRPSAL